MFYAATIIYIVIGLIVAFGVGWTILSNGDDKKKIVANEKGDGFAFLALMGLVLIIWPVALAALAKEEWWDRRRAEVCAHRRQRRSDRETF